MNVRSVAPPSDMNNRSTIDRTARSRLLIV
jgi:hypothetical protein